MISNKKALKFFLCGTAMGAADIVPGVSGGTIAYLAGIYPLLIDSIGSFNAQFFRNLFSSRFKIALSSIPWTFLIPLLCGILFSLLTVARIISHFLQTFPQIVWGFFFGLLLSSIILMLKRNILSLPSICSLAAGIFLAYCITHLQSLQLSHSLPHIFLSGGIALCAMILPGISGSFMLVLLGQYAFMLQAVVESNMTVLLVFILGGITGLAAFSRILSASFKKFPILMHALMLGIMAGCLPTVWPWQSQQALSLPKGTSTFPLFLACSIGFILPIALSAVARHLNPKGHQA